MKAALAGTRVTSEAELIAALGGDLNNPNVVALFDAARAGELNLEHPLVAELAWLSDRHALSRMSDARIMTECGQGLCPSVQGLAHQIDEAAAVASGAPPGEIPAFLKLRPTASLSRVAGQKQVIVESVAPEIDGGRVVIKRVVGDDVNVTADLVVDGHDVIKAVLRYKHGGAAQWSEAPMRFVENDQWAATFKVTALGEYEYQVHAWVDEFATWQRDIRRKLDAGRAQGVDFMEGQAIIRTAMHRASGEDAAKLADYATQMTRTELSAAEKVTLAEHEKERRVA